MANLKITRWSIFLNGFRLIACTFDDWLFLMRAELINEHCTRMQTKVFFSWLSFPRSDSFSKVD